MKAPLSNPPYPAPGHLERGLDLLFPPMCVECRRVGRWICTKCWVHVAWSGDATCGVCGTVSAHSPCHGCAHPGSALRSVVAVAKFEGTAREAVHALKYEGRHAIAGMMGRLMAESARSIPADVIVPTPLHAARRRERGYDQAALLARAISRELGVSCDGAAMKRIRHTRQQVSLDVAERRTNLAGAFAAQRPLHGERVLLVDDVYTTGATLQAAAGALRAGGAGVVTAVVFGFAEAGADAPDTPPHSRWSTWRQRARSTR